MWPRPCVSETEVVVFPSPAFVGVIAVVQISLASGLVPQPVEDRGVDLGLVRPVQVELLRLEPELARELRDRAERRRLGDLQAADHASLPGSGRAVWSRPRKLLAHALVLESALSLTTTGPSSIDSSSP